MSCPSAKDESEKPQASLVSESFIESALCRLCTSICLLVHQTAADFIYLLC